MNYLDDEKQHLLNKLDNQLLTKIKREMVEKGQYNKIDYKCQSFKSFMKLIENNQLFKELKYEKKIGDDEA